MSNGEYQVSLCTSAQQLQGVCKVRVKVFVDEQGFELKDEIDQYDPLAAHFALTHTSNPSKIIGTLRLIPYPLPIPKPDSEGGEPDPHSAFPLGGSRTESAIAGDFISAAWSSLSKPVAAPLDPSQTKAEEKQSADQIPNLGGAKLGRLAVLKEARGKKLGHLLVQQAEAWLVRMLSTDEAQQHGAFGPPSGAKSDPASREQDTLQSIVIKLSSQIYVLDFYGK